MHLLVCGGDTAMTFFFFFSSRRRHTRFDCDWSSDVCSSDLSVLTIVIGVTCAVAVLVSMLSMGTGARREALGNARDDRVVLSSLGAQGIFRDRKSVV